MRFVHRVLVGGLLLSLSAPVFAGRAAAPPARTNARTAQTKNVAGKLTLSTAKPAARKAFPYGSALHRLEEGEYDTLKSMMGQLESGTLADTFTDKAHTTGTDHVDLTSKYRAYNQEVQATVANKGRSFDYTAADQAIFAKHFAGTGLTGWRDYESIGSMETRRAYPIRREAATRTAASPVHAAVSDLASATETGIAKSMMAAAMKDPLTLALVMQVGAKADIAGNYGKLTPRQEAARTIYNGIAKISYARDRQSHGPGLAYLDQGRDLLFKFKVSNMWSSTTERGKEISLLSRDRIMGAARGVLTKTDLNDAIIGLDLE